MNLQELLRPKPETKASRVIAPTPDGKALVDTPDGVRTVANAAGQDLRSGNGVIISGKDNTVVGVDGMRETPKLIRIRG